MKLLTLFAFMMISSFSSFSQVANQGDRRFISVTGSADIVVAPDEIDLEIILTEYNSKSNSKVELRTIEAKLEKILKKHRIKTKNLFLSNTDYYWWYWWSYRNNLHKKRQFTIKVNSSTDIMSLVQDLDFEGISALRIAKTTSKNLQELRKEIKIEALCAAKDKAIYLLESIDEHIGKVISIEEVPDNRNYGYWYQNQHLTSNSTLSTSSSATDIENIATIRLRYEVVAKFEIE